MSIDLTYVKKEEIKQHAIDGPNRGGKKYIYICIIVEGKKISIYIKCKWSNNSKQHIKLVNLDEKEQQTITTVTTTNILYGLQVVHYVWYWLKHEDRGSLKTKGWKDIPLNP